MQSDAGHSNNITQKEIARYCGLSQQGVSLALRHDPSISEETIERVLAAAEELGYDPAQHESARRMALKKVDKRVLNHLVYFLGLMAETDYAYYLSLTRGVLRGAQSLGYDIVMGRYEGKAHREFPAVIRRGEVDAAMTFVRPLDPDFPDQLRLLPAFGDRPFVSLIWRRPGCLSVLADEEQAGYQAMNHLLDLGHRHILRMSFVQLPADPETQRYAGYLRALKERGLDPDSHLFTVFLNNEFWFVPPPFHNEPVSGLRCSVTSSYLPDFVPISDVLRIRPEITAILAMNDASALRAWYTLERDGFRIPQDISIIGFDDTDPMLDANGRNMLTSVRMPLVEMGEAAMHLLVRRLNNEVDADASLVLPTELIVCQSTTAPHR